MSSHYAILCLSHDPAITVGWDENWRVPETPLAIVANRTDPRIASHKTCRLLVGRYSYPLIEVCCPRSTGNDPGHSGFHPHSDHWIDAGWLRLLAVSTEAQRKAAERTGCWLYNTAHRLRLELNLVDADDPAASPTTQTPGGEQP